MKIGFTGTQDGMSDRQKAQLESELQNLNVPFAEQTEFHHGDCIGADAEAVEIAHDIFLEWFHTYQSHAHPPSDPKKRAFHKSDVIHPPEPYLIRNRRIVNATNILIAAPKTDQEELRSGTWATIRYAEKLGRKVIKLKR
jgi:hypothetical protein